MGNKGMGKEITEALKEAGSKIIRNVGYKAMEIVLTEVSEQTRKAAYNFRMKQDKAPFKGEQGEPCEKPNKITEGRIDPLIKGGNDIDNGVYIKRADKKPITVTYSEAE